MFVFIVTHIKINDRLQSLAKDHKLLESINLIFIINQLNSSHKPYYYSNYINSRLIHPPVVFKNLIANIINGLSTLSSCKNISRSTLILQDCPNNNLITVPLALSHNLFNDISYSPREMTLITPFVSFWFIFRFLILNPPHFIHISFLPFLSSHILFAGPCEKRLVIVLGYQTCYKTPFGMSSVHKIYSNT